MTEPHETMDTSWKRESLTSFTFWGGMLGAGTLTLLIVLFANTDPVRGKTQKHNPRAKTHKNQQKYRYQSKRCAKRWYYKYRAKRLAKEKLPPSYERLKSLHHLKCAPRRGDWLASQRERGQTFKHYHKSYVNRPNKVRKRIYLLPLGRFTAAQKRILTLTAQYVSLFFSVPVTLKSPKPLTGLPRWAKRRRFGTTQLLTRYMLSRYLKKRRTKDAVATIAFTSQDLWPGRGWNFVYGEAALYQRIGVWSLYRMGSPDKSPADFLNTLRRTMKIAVHEIGHIFSITHCIAYQCVMNGAMHMGEVDQSPLAMCPVCLRKLCWNTRCKPRQRFQQLIGFCKQHKLQKEQRFFQRLLTQWTQRKSPNSPSKHARPTK